MLKVIRNNKVLKENAAKLSYRIINNLLYFNNNERGLRLYISSLIKEEVFKLAYNEISYSSYARTHERLISNLYILRITSKLYKFIRYCHYY